MEMDSYPSRRVIYHPGELADCCYYAMAGKVGLLENTGKGGAKYNFDGILPEGLAPVPIPGYFGLSRKIACGLRLDSRNYAQT